jgi:hypothetical protein
MIKLTNEFLILLEGVLATSAVSLVSIVIIIISVITLR